MSPLTNISAKILTLIEFLVLKSVTPDKDLYITGLTGHIELDNEGVYIHTNDPVSWGLFDIPY